jgi:glutamine cyclotransferase
MIISPTHLLLTILLFLNTIALAEVKNTPFIIKADINLPKDCFTQGFLPNHENIYLSCGRYGESRIVKLNKQGNILKEKRVDDAYFLEDITMVNGQLWAITWREKTLLVFNPDTLQIIDTKPIPDETWGIAHVNDSIYISNGSSHIDRYDTTLKRIDSISIQNANHRPILNLNALSTIGDQLMVNVWKDNELLFIPIKNNTHQQPSIKIDLSSLNKTWSTWFTGITANGAFYDKSSQCLWVTGKKWGKAYLLALPSLDGFNCRPKQH